KSSPSVVIAGPTRQSMPRCPKRKTRMVRGSSPRMHDADIIRIGAYVRFMRAEELLVHTPVGLCCRAGGFHIDPLRPVERALVTHAHSDHARPGHKHVLATAETLDLMRLRYGADFAQNAQPIAYGERLGTDGVRLRVH